MSFFYNIFCVHFSSEESFEYVLYVLPFPKNTRRLSWSKSVEKILFPSPRIDFISLSCSNHRLWYACQWITGEDSNMLCHSIIMNTRNWCCFFIIRNQNGMPHSILVYFANTQTKRVQKYRTNSTNYFQ